MGRLSRQFVMKDMGWDSCWPEQDAPWWGLLNFSLGPKAFENLMKMINYLQKKTYTPQLTYILEVPGLSQVLPWTHL